VFYTRLVLICPSCGKENPEGAKFCNECAAPLVESAPVPALEERKIVSVLFCDLVGFTAASERQDPEDVRARIRPYHARLRRAVEARSRSSSVTRSWPRSGLLWPTRTTSSGRYGLD
jgi:hypothetical protein